MLPLLLKIIIVVLAIQLILLIFLKGKKKKIIFFTMILVMGIGAWQGWHEYNRPNKDLKKEKADVKISVAAILKEYESNDSMANRKYLGKVIELNGNVTKIENDDTGNFTLVLGESSSLNAVRCIMDTAYSVDAADVTEGSSVIIKGICTGYKKNEMLGVNLGSDIEINRAVVIKKK